MPQRPYSLSLRPSKGLTPGVATKLKLIYENTSQEKQLLKSFEVDPTWDDETTLSYNIDQSVAPGETFTVSPLRLALPDAIGPKPGIIVRVTIESIGTAKALQRLPINNTAEYPALVCGADDTELGALVYRGLNCWGFDIEVFDDPSRLTTLVNSDLQPLLVAGILPAEDASTSDIVAQAMETATANRILAYVFVPRGVEIDSIPSDVKCRCDPNNTRQFEDNIAPDLLAIRGSERVGDGEELYQSVTELGDREIRDLFRAYVQDQVLRMGTAAGGATIGAFSEDIRSTLSELVGSAEGAQRGTGDAQTGNWPMRGGNPSNTGSSKNTGPKSRVSVKWEFESIEGFFFSAPAIVNGTVYAVDGCNRMYALDAESGRLRWDVETCGLITSSPAVADGTVYAAKNRHVYALDAQNGRQRWHVETAHTDSPWLAVADGIVYVGNEDSQLYALDAQSGHQCWQVETNGKILASPAVADGTVYVGSEDNHVYAVDAKSGHQFWQFETDGKILASPAVADGTVYVGSEDSQLYALDAQSGRLRWDVETSGLITSSPAVADGIVYVGNEDSQLYALDAQSGHQCWQVETSGGINSSPAVADGTVYVRSGPQIYALDSGDGSTYWQFNVDDVLHSSPAVADGTIYVSGFRINALQ